METSLVSQYVVVTMSTEGWVWEAQNCPEGAALGTHYLRQDVQFQEPSSLTVNYVESCMIATRAVPSVSQLSMSRKWHVAAGLLSFT